MYHEIQAEDETHSKKSASTGSSSAIKSRSRVKSMSKHDQFIRLTHFLFAIKSGLGVKSGWRLDILFTLVLLFIVLETDFLLYVLSPAWISWYIFSTLFTTFRPIKSTLYSVFYRSKFQYGDFLRNSFQIPRSLRLKIFRICQRLGHWKQWKLS